MAETTKSVELDKRYVLNAKVATGGMGVIYQASDRLSGS